jgi:5-methylcytosine-specific restriction endonuclease McrA
VTINPLRSRPAIEIGDRPAPTKAQKTAAWNAANGLCWWCGKPVARDGLDVEWDHELPRGLTGDDSTANLAPLHVKCHAKKTFGDAGWTGDVTRVADAKRQSKLTAPRVRKASGFRKHPTLVRGVDGRVRERRQ